MSGLSPEEVATRQKQRNGLVMNAKKELANGKEGLKKDPIDLKVIQVILVKLRDYQRRIQELNYSIQDGLVGDAQDKDIQKMSDLDDAIMDMIANLDTTAEMRKEDMRVMRTGANTSRGDAHDGSFVSAAGSSRIRLPKIELMSYDGDPLKWDEFWDYYDITFHSNNDIPVIEKFTYLRSLLKGDAYRLVESYRLTEANYSEVISALKERFGDPEVAIAQHFDAMLTLQVASGDVNDLQRVFDACESHIRSLIALGLGEETFGRVFAPILLSKLPGNIRVELIRKKGRKAWTLAKLRELLRDELYARDMSKRSFGAPKQAQKTSANSSNNHSKHSNPQGTRVQATASALPTAGKESTDRKPRRKPPTCTFCGEAHFNNQCNNYPTVEARKKKIKGSCFICLGSGHFPADCERKKPCFHCQKTTHHQSLCEQKFGSKKDGTTHMNVSTAKSTDTTEKSVTSTVMSHGGQRGVLQTAVADVAGLKCVLSARHMLDNGSDNSFISTKLAGEIGARCIGSEKINVAGFADAKRRQQNYKIYEFDVVLRSQKRLTIKAYGTDVIICSIDKLAFDLKENPILTRLPLAEPLADKCEHVPVDILIGSDYYYEIVKTERISLNEGLMLLDSELGYIVAGRVKGNSKTAASMLLSRSTMPETNFNIERFWKLEEIGVKEPPDTNHDELALIKFNQSIRFDDTEQRYLVKWPYKDDHPQLPDNYGLAYGRLKSMIDRATVPNDLLKKCQEIFDFQIEKQIIEESPVVPDGPVHYLPHHAVVTPDKATTKVRVVYDASSKMGKYQPSLNDCLYRGPVIMENLCGLLLRFRLNSIAIVSDIEKAFLQVGLHTEDRDVTRFLWLRDISKPCSRSNLVCFRFRRVCFGVIASTFLLAATLLWHLKKIGTVVAKRIRSNLYVDNVMDGYASLKAALAYYKEAKDIFVRASMNLREWYSNSADFMAAIAEADRGKGSSTKVLGLIWDLEKDTLGCSVIKPSNTDVVTKRFVLHSIAKVFDPCGFFTPVTSPAKWLMQELWQKKYDWDTPLEEALVERWLPIVSDLQNLHECKIPRCCGPIGDGQSYQLHVFCDASAKSYCAAVYLVVIDDKTSNANLVLSKCRVSPLQQQTIPRLELLAATIGIRLLEFSTKELRLPIHKKVLWSDSQCVLHWIVGKPVSTVFVKNRVTEIKRLPDVEFRFVPTADNPADIPTRGMRMADFQASKLWWHGPEWLTTYDDWPVNPVPARHEMILGYTGDDETTVLATAAKDQPEYLFQIQRVSSLQKLLRITGWILRFIKNCRKPAKRSHRMNLRVGSARADATGNRALMPYLTANELRNSKLIWERLVQSRHFTDLLDSIAKKKSVTVKFLGTLVVNNDGLICCMGRLSNSELDSAAQLPTLLPKDDLYTRLVIKDYHERFNHAGVKQTLAELRCEYWVPRGRSAVKQVRKQCLLCCRQKGGSFEVPRIPDLPDFRVQKSAPFTTVGLDYLGPMFIFPGDGSRQKVWICLMTCAVTRAIHLEVVNQLDAAQFLLCFRRFIAFCGCPKLVVSDNAGQFNLSRRVLAKLWQESCQSNAVQEFSAAREISWKFIPESAPWMGGFYERLVGVVKSSLKSAIDRRKLSITELQTVVYETATIVNSRPLVYPEDEACDVPLTPAHLLMRHRTIVPLVSVGETMEFPKSTQDKLVTGWKRLSDVLDAFWSVWLKQYLLSLRERARSNKQHNVVRVRPEVGQVVLIGDKILPRSQWRVGRITELIYSADNNIRSVKLCLTNGNHMTRPIKQLYPIEIPDEITSESGRVQL